MYLAFALAYLLGSIPFGLLLTKAAGLGDVRSIGSGNIGATNVLRTGNKKIAAAVLLLDGIKGYVAVWLGYKLGAAEGYAILVSLLCGLIVVLAHVFPIWLKFKGGKGVATGLGATLALEPLLGLLMIATWLAMFGLKRFSSLAALSAFAAAVPIAYFFFSPVLALYNALLLVLIAYTHRANIKRLTHGTEHRFGTPRQ